MAEVYPFIGTRYNSQLIGSLSKVISPPHDAVTPDLQNALYERHEHNIIRIELAREESAGGEDDGFSNRYTRAANTLGTWRSDGIFIEDERPSFYLYEQVFKDENGNSRRRGGFLAKVKLEEKSVINPDTIDGITGGRADRLALIRSTKANISAISSVFEDEGSEVMDLLQTRMKEKPWEELTDEAGVVHRLWVVQKKDMLLKLIDMMKMRQLYIADGHQCYVTAQAYRDEMRQVTGKMDGKQPFDFAMMFLLPLEQESIRVEPLHRALTKSVMADVDLKDSLEELGENFTITRDKVDLAGGKPEADRLAARLAETGGDAVSLALIHASGAVFYMVMNDNVNIEDLYDGVDIPECVGRLDVCILHNYVINQVMVGNPEYELEDDECLYVHSAEKLLQLLKTRKAVCGFLLNPMPVSRMVEVACSGTVVPLETGILNPRPATGLVMRNMQTDIPKTARR